MSAASNDSATAGDPDVETGRQRRRGRRAHRRRVALGAVAAAAVMAVAGSRLLDRGASGASDSGHEPDVATATVTRGNVSSTMTVSGTLDTGRQLPVAAGASGVLTRMTAADSDVTSGSVLYAIDEQPTVLMLGDVPMYRDVTPGDTGADADQLQANFVALGYEGFTDDAVRQWQRSLGVTETGVVARSSVVFLPEGGRVGGAYVEIGVTVNAGAPVLEVVALGQVVNLDVDVADRHHFAPGTEATVELPGGAEMAGVVESLAVVGTPQPAQPAAGQPAQSPVDLAVAAVEVALSEPAPEEFEGTPVDVVVILEEHPDVLEVPINALLALSEGGFGLEVVDDGGSTHIVPVTTGLFADGSVEVAGDIQEGTVVRVAGR